MPEGDLLQVTSAGIATEIVPDMLTLFPGVVCCAGFAANGCAQTILPAYAGPEVAARLVNSLWAHVRGQGAQYEAACLETFRKVYAAEKESQESTA